LVRHGESQTNAEGRWAGWRDVPLTDRGVEQARAAGQRLRDAGIPFSCVLTSMLQRAVKTADALLAECGQEGFERRADWRLNERHAGMMQGRTWPEVKAAYGRDRARIYRRSWDQAPPPVPAGSEDDPHTDARYATCSGPLPRSEAMGDLARRVEPVWRDDIVPRLQAGESVLVVAHAMSLRVLARPVEGITEPGLPEWKMASAIPRCYALDRSLRPVHVTVLGDDEDATEE